MSNQTTNDNRFNAEAAAWDSNPTVHLASSLALHSILTHIPELKNNPQSLDVLEIGCGTGLLSFMIAPYVRSLVAVDSAQGMIDAFDIKLANDNKIHNITPVCALLEDPNDPRIRLDPSNKTGGRSPRQEDQSPRRFDLIISHLVLHHMPSLPSIFKTMYGCLKGGGQIALTDYEDFGPEARKFHPEAKMQGVERHGISRKGVEIMLKEAGFVDVKIETAFMMEKGVEAVPGEGVVKGEGGMKMEFPFLICLGRKD